MRDSPPDIDVNVLIPAAVYEDIGGPESKPEKLARRVDELGESIAWFRTRIEKHIGSLEDSSHSRSWKLDKVELTVSIDLEAESGIIFARAKAGAGFEVTMSWSREST